MICDNCRKYTHKLRYTKSLGGYFCQDCWDPKALFIIEIDGLPQKQITIGEDTFFEPAQGIIVRNPKSKPDST